MQGPSDIKIPSSIYENNITKVKEERLTDEGYVYKEILSLLEASGTKECSGIHIKIIESLYL